MYEQVEKIAQAFADRFGTVVDSHVRESWHEDVYSGIEQPLTVKIDVEIMGNTSPTGRPWSLQAIAQVPYYADEITITSARLVELGKGGEVIEVAL